LAKIEGDGVQRAALERAEFQYIDADDSGGERAPAAALG